MRVLPILAAAAFALAASRGTAHAQATPQGQKSDSQIETAGPYATKFAKPGKRANKKSKKPASTAR